MHRLTLMLPSWHYKLGHPSNKIKHLASYFIYTTKNISHCDTPCNSYNINKSHKLPFYQFTISSHAPLKIIFSNIYMVLFDFVD